MRILLTLFYCTFISFQSLACMCVSPDFTQAEFNLTQEIFVGRIINNAYDTEIEKDLLEFKVIESYKGSSLTEIIVQNQSGKRSISTCNFKGKVGEVYLIFLNEHKKYFSVSQCTRKVLISSLDDYVIPSWFADFSGIEDGRHCHYYWDDTLESEGQILNGKAEGEWKFYNEHGLLMTIGNYNNGLLEGEWVSFFSTGEVQEINNFKNGTYQGEQTRYHYGTNREARRLCFEDGKNQGNHFGWYPTGILAWEASYKNDSLLSKVSYDWDGVKWITL